MLFEEHSQKKVRKVSQLLRDLFFRSAQMFPLKMMTC